MVGTAGSTERNVPSFHYPYGSQAVHDVTLEDVPAIGLVAAHDSHCGWGRTVGVADQTWLAVFTMNFDVK